MSKEMGLFLCVALPSPALPGASPAGFSVSLLAGMTTVQRCCSTLTLFISHSSPRILPGFGDCLALWKPSCFARFSPPLLPSTGPATSFNTFSLPPKNQQSRAIIFYCIVTIDVMRILSRGIVTIHTIHILPQWYFIHCLKPMDIQCLNPRERLQQIACLGHL